ncbi:MAG TPA: ion transporter [Cytophagales bacterium]|nr:ion transporter [Cytophagales bacterium]
MNAQQTHKSDPQNQLKRQRNYLVKRIEDLLEGPMIFLGFVWLVLLVIELIWTLSNFWQKVSLAIYIIFILDFLFKFFVAPQKLTFLKKNVLTIISLVVPASRFLRITRAFRALRFFRASRSLRLVKIVGSINRGFRALSKTMERRAFGYVSMLTLLMLFIGAAGMYAFEKDIPEGLDTYGKALWWTAMLLTSMGSEYWPKTTEGQALCLILALYGFAVFGYFAAFLATFFIGQDAENKTAPVAGTDQVKEIKNEIATLRIEIQKLLIQKTEEQK